MVVKGISQDDFSDNGVGRRSNRSFRVTPQTRGSVDYSSTRGNTRECRVTRHFSRKSGRVSFVRGALLKYKTCIYLSQTVQYIQYIQSHEYYGHLGPQTILKIHTNYESNYIPNSYKSYNIFTLIQYIY